MTVTQAQPAGTAAAESPPLRLQRRTARIAGLTAAQLVAVEVAVLAVAVSLDQPAWVLVLLAVLALLVLAVAFARRGGRRWFEHLVVRRRFTRRARQAAAATASGTAGPLAALAPGLRISQITDRGNQIGVGQDPDGWFIALAVTRTGDAAHSSPYLLNQMAAVLTTPAMPASALQMVVHTVPAPTALLDRSSPAVQSYLELLQGEPPPVTRQVWVAVRLTARDALEAAAARGGGIEGVHRTLAAVAGRVSKALRAGGLHTRTLDAAQLATSISTVGDLETASAASPPREEWSRWTSGETTHVAFVLGGLPPNSLGAFLDELEGAPLLSASVSVLLTAGPEETLAVEALLRIAAHQQSEDEVSEWVKARGSGLGITLRRLDGQQAAGVYAAAPTGGGTP